jgi:hypothetical protein
MNEVKVVDVEKVINGLKWCSETAKEKGCIGCPYGYKVKDDIRCHLKKLIAESLAVILDLQTQIKVMQESYDEVIAEQVKLTETATAQKIYDKAKEYYNSPMSMVIAYLSMMAWIKECYDVEQVKEEGVL